MSYQHGLLTYTDTNLWRQCINKEQEFKRDHQDMQTTDFYKRSHSMAYGN